MNNDFENLPLIPLRGLTVFPNMVLHFDAGRKKTVASLEQAMINDQKIFLSTQKDINVEEPKKEDIYEVGTICNIKQIIRLPKDNIRVLVEGLQRARLIDVIENEDFYEASVQAIEELCDNNEDVDIKSLVRMLEKQFRVFAKLTGLDSSEMLMFNDETPENLADLIGTYLNLKYDQKQEILQTIDVKERLQKVLTFLESEIDLVKTEKKIAVKVKSKIDKSQKEYYLREQIKAIQEELGEDYDSKKDIAGMKEKLKKMKMPKLVKERLSYEINRLKSTGSYSSEYSVIKNYVEWVFAMPWNKSTKDNLNIKEAKDVLDEQHYALDDVKERIIEYLAVKKKANSLKGPILCLVGPPGVGKTSIAKSIASALNRRFVRMSLGGVRDEAELRGHRRTYVGAIPGRIVYGLKEAKSNNPVFLLDEIDKMSNEYKGDPADALLEILDSEQNKDFRDNYLELDIDLSDVLFITTANTLDTIPGPLRDRLEVIEVSGYTYEEKFHIADKYLIPRQLKENGTDSEEVKISDNVIKSIIENYTRESGVRNLERTIGTVIRKAVSEMMMKDKKHINITMNVLEKYLGPRMINYDRAAKQDRVGTVRGLAWTAFGGDTLEIEVMTMDGSGKLELTGQLGDVMKESAKAGYTYIRGNAKKLCIKDKFYKDKDIHIHVPEGAVPKDGPSAGVTMVTAMVSALTGRKVKHNVAMTGEITLTGRVLPIGGLKEKSLAAFRAGIDTIIIPKENENDVKKIPLSVRRKLNIIFAENIDDVLNNALYGVDSNEN